MNPYKCAHETTVLTDNETAPYIPNEARNYTQKKSVA